MPISVVMPALEMAQETGKLVAWRKQEGENVSKGETLLEVETDKAILEIEAPADGVLAAVKAQNGAVVPVGETIAWILGPGEVAPMGGPSFESPSSSGKVPAVAAAPEARVQAAAPGGKISPKARRLAKEHGVDLSRLHGSGPGGEILAADILAAAASPQRKEAQGKEERPAAHPEAEVPGPVGRLMAERTTQSWTTVPHFFVSREIDAEALAEARERLGPGIEQSSAAKLTFTDLLVALVGRVLQKHPRLNGSWTGEAVRLNPEINIGVAVAVDDGVVAPVIHNVPALTLSEIAVQRGALTQRARAGRLRPADIAGASFTISNLGMYDVDAFTAIISPPQAAILAVGSVAERVVAIDGQPAVRRSMTVTLSCDHRVVDGARAAMFLNDLNEAIRAPEECLG
jgi:pyruvate dehydrogenase E2 component (dihydrolipoamide acetyltransferase)